MNPILEYSISCPYCGEVIDVLISAEDESQQYIEDCQVCCRPITFVVSSDFNGVLNVAVYDENDVV